MSRLSFGTKPGRPCGGSPLPGALNGKLLEGGARVGLAVKDEADGFTHDEFHCGEHDAAFEHMPAGGDALLITHGRVQMQSVRAERAGEGDDFKVAFHGVGDLLIRQAQRDFGQTAHGAEHETGADVVAHREFLQFRTQVLTGQETRGMKSALVGGMHESGRRPDFAEKNVECKPGLCYERAVMSAPAEFTPTRWSLVSAVRSGDAMRSREAMEKLCRSYWYPLYAYVRRTGHGADDAADLTQGFFAQLIEKELLARADPERGKLRNFLLTALQRFVRDDWRTQNRQKRGGGRELLSIDEATAEGLYLREPAHVETPEKLYHRRWALTLLERALTGLRGDYVQQGKGELFDVLKPALTEEPDAESAAASGGKLGLTAGAVRVAVTRLRARYRQRLLAEVAASMDAKTEAEVDEEIDALFRALG